MPRVSSKVSREMMELGTHPHIVDLARRVYPTWISAHGHKDDRGVEELAREIGQCIAAIHHLIEVEGADAGRRYVVGHGIVVTVPPQFGGLGDDNFNVAVIAGTAFGMRLDMGVV